LTCSAATRSIARFPPPLFPTSPIITRTDDATIRNAVTSADLTKLAEQPLPWANAATGSAGVVTTIHEDKSSGFVCRDFKTTRHSFEGVASYAGQACLSETGEWLLTRFEQK